MSNLTEKQKIFETELSFLKFDGNRKMMEYLLENVISNEFFIIPPSSSGKYHPLCTVREGGLIIHVKRLIYFALQLADGHKFGPKEKDLLIMAGILHDCTKKGKYTKGSSYDDHAMSAIELIKAQEEKLIELVSREDLEVMYSLMKYHMGPFSAENCLKPLQQYSELELLFYHSDFLSSRKSLSTPVDNIELNIPKAIKDEYSGVYSR